MDLRTYLFDNKIKQREFANYVGIRDSYLSLLVNKKKLPRKYMQKLIEYATNGAVKEEDWTNE